MEDDATGSSPDVSAPEDGERRLVLPRSELEQHGSPANDSQNAIELDMSGGMSDAAREQFKECVKKYGSALAREASRLEEAGREEGLVPEITATMVAKANDYLRNPPVGQASLRVPALVSQILAFVGAILTPIFGATLHSYWQWALAVVCGVMASIAQGYAIFSVRRK